MITALHLNPKICRVPITRSLAGQYQTLSASTKLKQVDAIIKLYATLPYRSYQSAETVTTLINVLPAHGDAWGLYLTPNITSMYYVCCLIFLPVCIQIHRCMWGWNHWLVLQMQTCSFSIIVPSRAYEGPIMEMSLTHIADSQWCTGCYSMAVMATLCSAEMEVLCCDKLPCFEHQQGLFYRVAEKSPALWYSVPTFLQLPVVRCYFETLSCRLSPGLCQNCWRDLSTQ